LGGFALLALVFVLSTVALAFAAGYATRAAISRKRQAKYQLYEPYLMPPRVSQPPAFLIRSHTNWDSPAATQKFRAR
jgi:hypothetical protein